MTNQWFHILEQTEKTPKENKMLLVQMYLKKFRKKKESSRETPLCTPDSFFFFFKSVQTNIHLDVSNLHIKTLIGWLTAAERIIAGAATQS